MPYTATNNLNDLVETTPLGTEPVSNLGLAELETRRTFKAVILKEHNADGTHATVNGAVLVAGSVPASALAGSLGDAYIAAGGVGTASLAALSVTDAKIAAATITGDKLAAKTIPAAALLSTGDAHILVANNSGGFAEVAMSGGATISDTGVVTLVTPPITQAIALFNDTKASGTSGGTFTSGAWQTHELNSTVIDSASLFNLSANVLTWSKPGTYYIKAEAVAYKVDLHQVRLFDTTNNVVIADGTAACAAAAGTDQTLSTVETVLVITGTQTMSLQHQCGTTQAANGFGLTTGFGDSNVFARITIIKLA